jgi:hypothetical protein
VLAGRLRSVPAELHRITWHCRRPRIVVVLLSHSGRAVVRGVLAAAAGRERVRRGAAAGLLPRPGENDYRCACVRLALRVCVSCCMLAIWPCCVASASFPAFALRVCLAGLFLAAVASSARTDSCVNAWCAGAIGGAAARACDDHRPAEPGLPAHGTGGLNSASLSYVGLVCAAATVLTTTRLRECFLSRPGDHGPLAC